MTVSTASLSTSSADAPGLVLRQALDADRAQAQALPPPPPVGHLVDVYARS